jgi:hypothetical protein
MAKAKRKTKAKTAAPVEENQTPGDEAEDPMSQAVVFCQEQRWREALTLFMTMCEKAEREDNTVMVQALAASRQKVEYSLRRQMVAGLVRGARQMLQEEYLLDVGE